MAQKDYGNEALNRSKVFRWYSRFRNDDVRGAAPKSTRKEVNNTAVDHFVKNDLRIAIEMKAQSLNLP
jgi:hypothetical protein